MARRNLLATIAGAELQSSDSSILSRMAASREPPAVKVEPIASPARRSAVAPSRAGRKAVTVHVDEDVRVRLKVMAAQERTTVEALMHEAIGLMFEKRGVAPIRE